MRRQDSDRTKRSASGTSHHFAALRTCDAGIKFGGTQFPRNDGGKQARSSGSAKETVKTIARGMPGVSGVTVVTNARVYYTPRAAAGASGARHSLRPLITEGGKFLEKLAHACGGIARPCLDAAGCLTGEEVDARSALKPRPACGERARASCERGGGAPDGVRLAPSPLTRRLRCAPSPTFPRKRGEVKANRLDQISSHAGM